MNDLVAIDNQLLEIFQSEKALEILKTGLAQRGLTVYSVGYILQKHPDSDSLVVKIGESIRAAEAALK